MTRIGLDALVPALCTRQTHDEIKANADTFAAATIYVGVWLDGMILATCRNCGSSITYDPTGWSDDPEDTIPIRNACVRP